MGKSKLDERQEQIAARIGARSFYVMFFAAAVVILGEVIWKGDTENLLGETLIFAAGGVTCLAGYIKNGIWTGGSGRATTGQNLLGSVICAGIFTIFFGIAIERKVRAGMEIGVYVFWFFLGIAILCFICLSLMERAARKKRERQEAEYSE